jgi:hypothetical protein
VAHALKSFIAHAANELQAAMGIGNYFCLTIAAHLPEDPEAKTAFRKKYSETKVASPELYDLKKDRSEQNNVADAHPKL